MGQRSSIKSINLVVRNLSLYVVKERIHCLLVARLVATLFNAVAMFVRGNQNQKHQFSPCHQTLRTSILDLIYVGDI